MNVDWDFINVQAYLMMMRVWSMYKYPCWWSSGFNQCLKTNFLSSWQKFGHDDNSNCHRDQIFVTMTKNWSRDNSNCHRDQIFVTMTKNWSRDNSNCHRDQFFVIVTKFLSRWQKIGHATKNKKTERKALRHNNRDKSSHCSLIHIQSFMITTFKDFIHVQATLMMIVVISSISKHPWRWLLRFDACQRILDDDYWDLINVQAYLIMMIGILSTYKHPWWWWLGFDPCVCVIRNLR